MQHSNSLYDLNQLILVKENKQFQASLLKDYKSRLQGYGLSSIQSSSTLQKSVNLYSFPKSERFKQQKQFDIELSNLRETLRKNGISLGYGKKNYFTFQQKQNMLINPGPDAYIIKYKQKGDIKKSFGLPYSEYKKAEKLNETPGPGHYYVNQQFGIKSSQIKIKGQKNFNLKNNNFPSPCEYQINDKILQNQRYKNIKLYNETRILF